MGINKQGSFEKLFEIADLKLIFADVLSNEANEPSHNLQINTSPKNAICITYTSGSTGKPKGVKITHEGIVNRLFWMWNAYPFEENERCAIKTSISFVDHMWELFGPLTKGITSVLFTREEVINLDILAKKLQDEKITRWVIVPSLLRALLDKLKSEGLTLPDLRYWTSSGETLSLDLMEEFYRVFPSSSHKLLNIYGSSEVTADVTCYDASEVFNAGNVAETSWYKKGSGSAPIGKPIANNQVYIVDKEANYYRREHGVKYMLAASR
jgi:non-ribosomal peptide synthetase component F